MSYFSAPVIPFWKVEEWVRDYCRKWWKEYEANFARDWNLGDDDRLPEPRHWETSSEFNVWDENSLPHIVIISPGLTDEPPYRHANGQIDATILMTFVHLAGAGARGPSRKLAGSYAAITTQMLEQAGNCERPEIREVRFVDHDNGAEVPDSDTIAAASVTFEIEIVGLMSTYGGPPAQDPRPDPDEDPGDRPVVLETNIDIRVVEETDLP